MRRIVGLFQAGRKRLYQWATVRVDRVVHVRRQPTQHAVSQTELVRKLFLPLARALLVALLAVFDLTPFVFLLPVPESDSWTITGLVMIVLAAGYLAYLAVKAATPKQRAILPVLAVVAVLNVLTKIGMNHLPSTLVDRMGTEYIASIFHLDGELAYDAALYEVWCELWLCLALVTCAMGWTVRRMVLARR